MWNKVERLHVGEEHRKRRNSKDRDTTCKKQDFLKY